MFRVLVAISMSLAVFAQVDSALALPFLEGESSTGLSSNDLPSSPADFATDQNFLNGIPPIVGVGVNVLAGTFSCQGFGCLDPADAFIFEVPNGLAVVNISFDSAFEYAFFVDGVLSAPSICCNTLFTVNLGPGFYSVTVDNFNGFGGNWETTFTGQAAVPEPSAAILLGLPLLVMGIRHCRVPLDLGRCPSQPGDLIGSFEESRRS